MIYKFIIPGLYITKGNSLNLPTPFIDERPELIEWLEQSGITAFHLEWVQNTKWSTLVGHGGPGSPRYFFDTAIVFYRPSDAALFRLRWNEPAI